MSLTNMACIKFLETVSEHAPTLNYCVFDIMCNCIEIDKKFFHVITIQIKTDEQLFHMTSIYCDYYLSCNYIETECPEGTYGPGCLLSCACQNNASCGHISGACVCAAGWRGLHCDRPCPPGYYGIDCENMCNCDNGARCDPVSGSCQCRPGWMGQGCSVPCPHLSWGNDCKQVVI